MSKPSLATQSTCIMPRPFSGKENEDFEAFSLDFDNACDANVWDDTTPLARPVRPAPIRTRGETSGSPDAFISSRESSSPAPPKEATFYTRYSEACSDVPYAPDDIPTPKLHYAEETKFNPSGKPDVSLPTRDYECPGPQRGTAFAADRVREAPLGRGLGDSSAISHNPFIADLEAKDEDTARKLHCKLVSLKSINQRTFDLITSLASVHGRTIHIICASANWARSCIAPYIYCSISQNITRLARVLGVAVESLA